ncbi:pheromone A receptor-domain-containing protein [Trametes polyzona]|nr:pheromone A receptor-domain-containing protein [Trametes polyzona]
MTLDHLAFAAFLAAVLVLIPLPWHWRARNIPTLSLIAWLFMINVAHGVNVILWWGNLKIRVVVWCDIVSKLVISANMALPAACFCLAMRLEGIAAVRQVKTSHLDKRQRVIVDLAICVGIPLVYMALHYVVQGHRFDIIEDFGCQPDSYVSIPEFFLVWFVPILSCLGTFILGGMAFMHFFRRRATFARHLAASNSGLTPSRYFRLMSMSLALVIWDVVIFALTLSWNYRNGLRPWTNWADVHSNWLAIGRFPMAFIPADDKRWLYFIWWTAPTTAYMFFAFFAFGRDASVEYGACVRWSRYADKLRPFIRDLADICPSVSAPRPPRLRDLAMAESKSDMPESPITSPLSIDYSKFNWPETPSTGISTTSASSSYAKVAEARLSQSSLSDDPSPPYPSSPRHPPSPLEPPSPIIIAPPPALVAHGGRVIAVSPEAHTDQMV